MYGISTLSLPVSRYMWLTVYLCSRDFFPNFYAMLMCTESCNFFIFKSGKLIAKV